MMKFFKRKKTIENVQSEEHKGVIGRYKEDEYPVVVRFVKEIPDASEISRLPWFTVISWKYVGGERNGMPSNATKNKMIELENALNSKFDSSENFRHAYNRTGNFLKEFNYYITDRDEFMKQFNDALTGHEAYPIEINFYKDPDWVEMKKLLEDFELKR